MTATHAMGIRTTAALVALACGGAESACPLPDAHDEREAAPAPQTCRRDQSGIDWLLPFDAARARARAEQRLLFIKPIAFGTSADGGW